MAWRNGDAKAGNQLFSRHYASVYRFLVNKVDGEVEDLLQRTFEVCAGGAARFEGRSSFRAYVLGVAKKLVLQHWDRRRRRPSPANIEEHAIHELGAGPSTLVARGDEQRRLLEALRRLPLEQQILLELYYWEERSGPELAAFLEVPEDTARSRLRRAKLKLHTVFNELERSESALESTNADLERWAGDLRAQLEAT